MPSSVSSELCHLHQRESGHEYSVFLLARVVAKGGRQDTKGPSSRTLYLIFDSVLGSVVVCVLLDFLVDIFLYV